MQQDPDMPGSSPEELSKAIQQYADEVKVTKLTCTKAEHERLSCITEEAGEAVQAAMKIQRFGFGAFAEAKPKKEALEIEVGHFLAAASMMIRAGDLDGESIFDAMKKKLIQYDEGSVLRWQDSEFLANLMPAFEPADGYVSERT